MILSYGSIAYDLVMDFDGVFADHILPDNIHKLSVSFPIKNLCRNFGGTGAGVAYALALHGYRPRLVGQVGGDFNAYRKYLKKLGINDRYVRVFPDEQTSQGYIMADRRNNQIAAFYHGAMRKKINPWPSEMFQVLRWATVSAAHPGDMISLCKEFKKHQIPYLFDPGQALPVLAHDGFRAAVENAKIFSANDYEWELTSRKLNRRQDQLLRADQIGIKTLGEKGSLITHRGNKIRIPAVSPERALDPTGAGDVYRAGFLHGLISNWDLKKSARWAATAASFAVENRGAQSYHFRLADVKKRYEEAFGKLG